MQSRLLLLALLALAMASVACAQSFTYQGFLKDGGIHANGSYDFRFMLWTQPTGGSQIGPELYVDAVSVQNGLFTVQLDFGSVWDGSDRYLEIKVRRVSQFGYWLLQPRVKINPTPYAAFALRPWQTAGSTVFYNDGNVGIGTNAPAARLSLGGGNANTKLALWQGGTAADVMGFGIAPDQFRLHLHNPNNRFSFLDAPNGNELVTILGTGNVGIGTSSPQSRLHVETGTGAAALRVVHTATSGHVDGVKGVINTTRGAGVSGEATAASGETYGGWFQSNSSDGYGVAGLAIAGSGTTYGVYGQSNSPAGYGVAGLATAASGQTGGVLGVCQSSGGAGVAGFNIATTGTNFGVYGESRSPAGRGVYGVAIPDNGTNFGVLGQTNSPDGYGVYSLGRLAATNKMFQIDHPLRPETHYLNHFCIEGPEPYTAYSGNVVTDEKGYATVQLPDYFESINRDFRYQLTVIDGAGEEFVQARVVREIQSNQFIIRTSKPFVKVSWEVKAVRNDLWIQRYGYQAEQEKPEGHRGKYLYPELYGQPKERGIYYRPEPERERPNEVEKPK